jgi:hypothetical protein
MFYSHLKTQLSGEGRPTAVVNFCSGTFAAVAATLLTQPADVVRTRMQLGVGNVRTMDTLGHVMRQGTRGMLTGGWLGGAHGVPGSVTTTLLCCLPVMSRMSHGGRKSVEWCYLRICVSWTCLC